MRNAVSKLEAAGHVSSAVTGPVLRAADFCSPRIHLSGPVDYDMYSSFRTQFEQRSQSELTIIEISTLGGDPEVARMIGEDVRFSKQLTIDGPLTTCLSTVEATLNELKCSIAIQNEGFRNLVAGSTVTFEEVLEKAPSNWYVEAEDAQRLGLIAGVI